MNLCWLDFAHAVWSGPQGLQGGGELPARQYILHKSGKNSREKLEDGGV
jgi:hypothetical protein